MPTYSSAEIIARAKEQIDTALTDLAPILEDSGYYDWTNLQGAENSLLQALVDIKIAKQGVLRRSPSFGVPEFHMGEADLCVETGNALAIAWDNCKKLHH